MKQVIIHSHPYFDLQFSLADAPDRIQQSRVAGEDTPGDLRPGDQVTLHFVMGMVVKVEKADP
ncbi:MAG: hypothetical protein ACE5NC_04400 [Anaerolineae bacterium]